MTQEAPNSTPYEEKQAEEEPLMICRWPFEWSSKGQVGLYPSKEFESGSAHRSEKLPSPRKESGRPEEEVRELLLEVKLLLPML